jgi:hypothetical protein
MLNRYAINVLVEWNLGRRTENRSGDADRQEVWRVHAQIMDTHFLSLCFLSS